MVAPGGPDAFKMLPGKPLYLFIGPHFPEERLGGIVNKLRDDGYEVEVDRPLRA